MKNMLKVVAVSVAAVLAASCGSTKVAYTEEEFNQAFADEDYGACVSMIQSKKKDKRNAILNSLDADMLMHLNGDYLDSAKAFMDTQTLMQQSAKDTSGGKAFAATIAGENSVTYTGTVYERILAYSMRATNALALGDVSNAKGVMDTYTGDYKDIIAPLVAAQKELAAESEECLEDDEVTTALSALGSTDGLSVDFAELTKDRPSKSDKMYETSPFLSYLGTVVYAANGDTEHANDFASALQADNADIDVSEDIAVPEGKGRIDVVALSGTIGKRTEQTKEFALGAITFEGIKSSDESAVSIEDSVTPIKFKIAYPVFEEQNHAISTVRVTLSDGTAKTATLIEDFDEAVRIDVESKASGAFGRSVFRNVTKNAAAISAGLVTMAKAREKLVNSGSLINQLAYGAALISFQVGLNVIIEAEQADVRQGAYFPHKASAAGFTVNPGTYSVTVEYLSHDGSVVETKEQSNIVVEAGKPTVVVSTCAK